MDSTESSSGARSVPQQSVVETNDTDAHSKFGGLNPGAAFFGWLVAVAVSVLIFAIITAVLAAIGAQTNISQSDAQQSAGAVGLAAAIVFLVVLGLGYFAGGYVAGRMSRFDGARQGFGVWLLGLLITILAIVVGYLFGSEYNVLDQINLPRVRLSGSTLGWGALITLAAVLLLTLLAAIGGGLMGHRYHNRVDRAVRD